MGGFSGRRAPFFVSLLLGGFDPFEPDVGVLFDMVVVTSVTESIVDARNAVLFASSIDGAGTVCANDMVLNLCCNAPPLPLYRIVDVCIAWTVSLVIGGGGGGGGKQAGFSAAGTGYLLS